MIKKRDKLSQPPSVSLGSLLTNAEDFDDHPEQALPLGTLIRAKRFDRLGVITDSFYGDIDENKVATIIYTVFLFPPTSFAAALISDEGDDYYISHESEYDIIAYLMMNPINLKKLVKTLGG
jgi:hypothetical protein